MATAFRRVNLQTVKRIANSNRISIEGKVAVNKLQTPSNLKEFSSKKNGTTSSVKTEHVFALPSKSISTSTLSSSTNFFGKANTIVASSFSTFPQNLASSQLPQVPSELATNKNQVTHADIMPIDKYTQLRPLYYKMRKQIKENRRLEIHEMLWIEKGGDKQIDEELAAYNPLIPQGANLVFTFMLEYPDAKKRPEFLRKLGHIEDTLILSFGEHKILAVSANDEIKRTTDDGKTSALHFLRFNFSPKQIEDFKKTSEPVTFEIGHKNYSHSTKLQQSVLDSLRNDLQL